MSSETLFRNVEAKLRRLVEIGKLDPAESSYNMVLIVFWREYDHLGDGRLYPDELTPALTIDRVWRKVFRKEKGDETAYKEYVREEKPVCRCGNPDCSANGGGFDA